jgi:hypothetical protein
VAEAGVEPASVAALPGPGAGPADAWAEEHEPSPTGNDDPARDDPIGDDPIGDGRAEADVVRRPVRFQPARGTADRWAQLERPSRESGPVPAPAPRRSRRPVVLGLAAVVLMAVLFAAGISLGRGLGPTRPAEAEPADPSPVTTVLSTTTATATVPASVAPRACLDTARFGDQVIALLTANVRDQRLDVALKRYTQASQRCRAAAAG